MINFLPTDPPELKPRITVIGVGGAGGNAVNNMIASGLGGVEFVVANTDAQALTQSRAERRIQLGTAATRGLGAGSRPDIGRTAAEESLDEIMAELQGSNMVFITAGMGGGTGTGAAPVMARAAREQGILTVGVVTKPFTFEGRVRMRTAEAGIEELHQYVDTLIIIPNQNLFRVASEKTTFADAFKMADDVLNSGVRGVTDLMVVPGIINLDFADIRTVMSEMGKAMMGTGEGEGEERARKAADAAINNPLLDDTSMKGARGVLINITGGDDITLFEVDEAVNRIGEEIDPEANIIFGTSRDPSMEGKLRISVVATGIDAEEYTQPRPTYISLAQDNTTRPPLAGVPAQERPAAAPPPRPATAHQQDEPPAEIAATVQEQPEPAAEPEPRLALDDQPVQAPPRPRPTVVANRRPAAPEEEPQRRTPPRLFERLAGLANRAPSARADRPEPQPEPTARPATPRLSGVDRSERLPMSQDEDLLDIPAFLRRQAN